MKKVIYSVFLVLLCCTSFTTDCYAGDRLEIPGGVLYHRFSSQAFGPEATWINPAGLAYEMQISFQMIGEIYDSKLSKNWGFNVTGDGIGIAYRSIDDVSLGGEPNGKFSELFISGGKMLNNSIAGGMMYRYIKEAPEQFEQKNLWGFGLLIKPASKFTYGIVFSNVGKAKHNGSKTDFEQNYSLTYNAMPNIHITAEMSLSSSQSMKEAVFNYGIEVAAKEGLYLFGNWRDGGGYEIGVRMNIFQYFIGGQSRHDDNNDNTGTSVYAGYVTGTQDSFVKEKKPQSRAN